MKFWVFPHNNLKDHLLFVNIAEEHVDGKILIPNLIQKQNRKNLIRILQEKVLKKIGLGNQISRFGIDMEDLDMVEVTDVINMN